jgi:hypothetical protein
MTVLLACPTATALHDNVAEQLDAFIEESLDSVNSALYSAGEIVFVHTTAVATSMPYAVKCVLWLVGMLVLCNIVLYVTNQIKARADSAELLLPSMSKYLADKGFARKLFCFEKI